jgi:hypothetical protein
VSIIAAVPAKNFIQSELRESLSVKLSLNAAYPIREPIMISIKAIEIFRRFARMVDIRAAKNQKVTIE